MKAIREFLKLESAGSVLLLIAAVLAMLIANSPLSPFYGSFLQIPLEVRAGNFEIAKPLLLWINDGLMAIFFFLIGLELKREVLEGELSKPSQIVLPAIGALGGMSIPALIYVFLNRSDPLALNGWAIPAATDIAFALGVLASLGNRVPTSLKIFLLTLAIFDDLGAIIIIAVFYTSDLSLLSLLIAAVFVLGLFMLNRRGVRSNAAYIFIGIALWIAVLKSGVHATLAGVLLALFIPHKGNADEPSLLKRLEHDLHPAVAFGILPIFAFANAGVPLAGLTLTSFLQPVSLGIALGLLIGNQVGIFGFTWLAVKLGLARLPESVRWIHMYGVSFVCGIGFTMSLFIGSLAFEHSGTGYGTIVRLGILTGSILSAFFGYVILRLSLPTQDNK
jgi:NhaA family Na+:H+ antiporter